MSGSNFYLSAPEWSWGGFSWDPKGEDYRDFRAKRGDTLEIYLDGFNDKSLGFKLSKATFVTAYTKQSLKEYAKSKHTFIYDRKSGKLYFNGNRKKSGFSSDYKTSHDGEKRTGTYGGVLARLKPKQEIYSSNLKFICVKGKSCFSKKEITDQTAENKYTGSSPKRDKKNSNDDGITGGSKNKKNTKFKSKVKDPIIDANCPWFEKLYLAEWRLRKLFYEKGPFDAQSGDESMSNAGLSFGQSENEIREKRIERLSNRIEEEAKSRGGNSNYDCSFGTKFIAETEISSLIMGYSNYFDRSRLESIVEKIGFDTSSFSL